ncbi:MAG: hypothetical protein ACYC91_17500 [Solirubrobacteraceae bacterium]
MSRALFERAANGRDEARSAGTTPAERIHTRCWRSCASWTLISRISRRGG